MAGIRKKTKPDKTDEKKQQNPKYFRHKLPDSWEEAWEMEKDRKRKKDDTK